MTASHPSIPNTFEQAQGGIKDEEKSAERGYSTTKASNNTRLPPGIEEWTKAQASLANVPTNATNYARISNSTGNTSTDELDGEQKYMEMHNNSYLKGGGYSDGRPYYGWMPAGFAPMRFPAFIYPHSFLSFAPTVAWMKTNDESARKTADTEKTDRWESTSKNDTGSSCNSEVSQDSANFMIDDIDKNSDKFQDTAKCSNSDDDEGMVLDDKETMKRRRQKDVEKFRSQTAKPQPERSSVIQENISIQAKQSVITHDQSASSNHEERDKPAKRGRASTRQIEKTEQYWDRRKKNNVSAKKSRDARRQREALMNQRSAMLETENLRLRAELATFRDENSRLKQEVDSLKNIRT
jgi:hypothetical protein